MLEAEPTAAFYERSPVEFPTRARHYLVSEDYDAFVSNHYQSLNELPEGAVVEPQSAPSLPVKERFPHLIINDSAAMLNALTQTMKVI